MGRRSAKRARPLVYCAFHIFVPGEVSAVGLSNAFPNFFDLPLAQDGILLNHLWLRDQSSSVRHAVAPKRTETSLDTPGSCIVTP